MRLSVKVTAKSKHAGIGPIEDAPGGPRLKIAVSAPPDKGKANAALCRLIAGELGVAKSRISVVSGAGSRLKEIAIDGEAAELLSLVKQEFGEN